jgi:PAS domain S-box-containing protein
MEPNSPVYDPYRLDIIHRATLLSLDDKESFDRLSRLVTRLLDVPVGAVTIVHPDGQTFIGAAGLTGQLAKSRGTPLDQSYCRHVVESGVPLITGDARLHPLLHDSPGLLNEAIAYAGIPVVVNGETVATLCAIDSKPRKWSKDDIAMLGELVELASAAIELRLLKNGSDGKIETRGEANFHFSAVFENSRSGMFILSPEGKVLRSNPAMERMVGGREGSLAGHYITDFACPEDRDSAIEMYNQVVTGALSSVDLGEKCVALSGEIVWGRKTVTAVRGADNVLICLIAMKDDATAERSAESKLSERNQDLVQSQKMDALGQLASGIAHDFNNMLTVITAYCGIALSDAEPGSDLHENLTEVESAARKAAALTRQLLTFSRRRTPHLVSIQLNDVVNEMRTMLAPILSSSVTIGTDLASDLGTVRADRTHLEQLVMNLAVNARDAMPGGGTLTLATRNLHIVENSDNGTNGLSPGAYVELIVADTGTGIPKPLLGRIFDPFFTTKSEGKGTGLGLATVQGIVSRMGGKIGVISEMNKGTQFRVILPAA